MFLGDIMKKKNNKMDVPKLERKFLIIVITVAIVLALFYFLTYFILNKDDSKKKTDKTEIQYEEILLGTSFDVEERPYVVLYYDSSDEEESSQVETFADGHIGRPERLNVYKVDMNDGFNKKHIAKKSNSKATNADQLKINGLTLIRFENKKIVEYIEGFDEINDYLN